MRLRFHITLELAEDINYIQILDSSFSILFLTYYSLVSALIASWERNVSSFYILSDKHRRAPADSILWFFRAYKDKNGRTIFSLRSIARRYVTSGWFFVNLLACTPTVLIVYFEYKQQYFVETLHAENIRFYYYFGLFKLFRLYGLNARIKHLMSTSKYASGLWVKINIMTARMFLFLVAVIL